MEEQQCALSHCSLLPCDENEFRFGGWKKTKAKVNHFDYRNSIERVNVLFRIETEQLDPTRSMDQTWIKRLSDFGADLIDRIMSWIGFGSTTTGLRYKSDRLVLSTLTRFRFVLRGLLLLPFSAAASHLFSSAAPIAFDADNSLAAVWQKGWRRRW
ncbi:hypothetical protein MUK42_36546 [Musa troglodytarum]|uniref:Uncharacterized protein n=1 Tax=Musa troglodytarum TaxID=320322 RepID=A0A9E7K7Y0_9LILI|nr:hypothetical protein MUK42_36546 [Musa troglodytarum]